MNTCIECGITERERELHELTISGSKDGEVVMQQEHRICEPCANALTEATWGVPGIESEIEYVDKEGNERKIGFDGETTYVPVDLPDNATDDQIAAVMGDAAKQLGFD